MATTYTLISSATPSGVTTVTFSSIPQTYTDLVILGSLRASNSSIITTMWTLTNTGGTAYSTTRLYGDGSAVTSARTSNNTEANIGFGVGGFATANTFGNVEIYYPNYTNSSNKPIGSFGVSENNATTSYIEVDASLLRTSSAITSITIGWSGNAVSGSSFYLYGIKNS